MTMGLMENNHPHKVDKQAYNSDKQVSSASNVLRYKQTMHCFEQDHNRHRQQKKTIHKAADNFVSTITKSEERVSFLMGHKGGVHGNGKGYTVEEHVE
jgi:hypothetical protein